MHTAHRLAVVAVCSLPLLLAGCTTAVPDARANVAPIQPAKVATAAGSDSAAGPHSNPVQVLVTGTVLAHAGGPMLGATISVRPASTSHSCASCGGAVARTDSAGRFSFTLTRGTYLVTCRARGGTPCRIEGDAEPGPLTVTSGTRDLVLTADR